MKMIELSWSNRKLFPSCGKARQFFSNYLYVNLPLKANFLHLLQSAVVYKIHIGENYENTALMD